MAYKRCAEICDELSNKLKQSNSDKDNNRNCPKDEAISEALFEIDHYTWFLQGLA